MVPDEWPIETPSEDDGGYPARPAGRRRLPTVRKDFFLDPRDRLTEQERALMTAMLAELLGSIADEIRGAIQQSLFRRTTRTASNCSASSARRGCSTRPI